MRLRGYYIRICRALLSKVSNIALKNELTGLEFAAGIPGTLGGAVAMNAGHMGRNERCCS